MHRRNLQPHPNSSLEDNHKTRFLRNNNEMIQTSGYKPFYCHMLWKVCVLRKFGIKFKEKERGVAPPTSTSPLTPLWCQAQTDRSWLSCVMHISKPIHYCNVKKGTDLSFQALRTQFLSPWGFVNLHCDLKLQTLPMKRREVWSLAPPALRLKCPWASSSCSWWLAQHLALQPAAMSKCVGVCVCDSVLMCVWMRGLLWSALDKSNIKMQSIPFNGVCISTSVVFILYAQHPAGPPELQQTPHHCRLQCRAVCMCADALHSSMRFLPNLLWLTGRLPTWETMQEAVQLWG